MSATTFRRLPRVLPGVLLAAALLATAACDTVDKADRPAKLATISPPGGPQKAWSASIGGQKPKLRLGLAPATDGQRLYVASPSGEVRALDVSNGHRAWEHKLKLKLKADLAGGPAVGEGLVVVGSSTGELVALAAADGSERWRTRVNSEILSAAAIGGGMVVLRTVDGHLYGFSASNGEQRWVTDQQVPRLSMRGLGAPVIVGDLAVAGFDNGRLMAVSLGGGATAWDIALAQSRGSSELARMVDVDSAPVVDGNELYAVAYQGRAARVAADTGRDVWTHEISSSRGLALGPVSAYATTPEGDVVRLDRAGGGERWRTKLLAHRRLSAPVVAGKYLVVGDNLGFLHWLDAEDGTTIARAKVGAAVSVAPLYVAGLVIVQTEKGGIEAWRPERR